MPVKDPIILFIKLLSIRDDQKEVISIRKSLKEIQPGEWFPFYMRLRLSEKRIYSVEISVHNATFSPQLLLTSNLDQAENTSNGYNAGEEIDGQVLVAYGYAQSASTWEKTVLSLLILFCSVFCLYFIDDNHLRFNEKKKSFKKNIPVISGILLAIQFVLVVPDIKYYLENIELDPSWRYFLNIANAENITFGKDVFFTYGPLGYLCYLMKTPENTMTYWSGVLIWLIVIALHVYVIYRIWQLTSKRKFFMISVVLSVLCTLASYSVITRDNYLLYLLILCIGTIFVGGKHLYFVSNTLLVLMFFCKFSTFTSGIAFCILFIVFELLFNKNVKSLLICLPGLVLMPVLYLLYSPSIRNLYNYVTGILKISDGWMQTQQFDNVLSSLEVKWLITIVAAYCILVFISIWSNYKTSSVMLACSASMFFVYKYATTRHGLNVGLWLFGMLFSAVMISFDFKSLYKKCKKTSMISTILCTCVFASIAVIGILQAHSLQTNTGYVKEQMEQKIYSWMNLSESSVTDEIIASNQLPSEIIEILGNGTVTVYPWRNGYAAIHPEINMVYYPSIQNVNINTPWLDEIVAKYFDDDNAAEYIILNDQTVDNHIQYWDNPLTWQAISDNYSVVLETEAASLLMRNKIQVSKNLKLLNSETYYSTEKIVCPENADYAKIYFKLSFSGKIKKFIYHIGEVYMNLECEDGISMYGRIVVPNMVSGIELSKPPVGLNELTTMLNTEHKNRIECFSFGGLGLQDFEDEIIIEWFQYQ